MHGPTTAKQIFFDALDKTSLSDRAILIAQACGTDASLQREVELLLEAHDQPDARFDRLTGNLGAPPAPQSEPANDALVGTSIGPYKLRELLGEGGMGVVYVAEQTHPVRRKVALKIIKPGMDSRQVIARFEAERQALAMMDHPNIARVLDAGTTGRESWTDLPGEQDSAPGGVAPGRPYFVMELVRGMPITDYCDQAQLTPHQRLEIFITVCRAIQHAHQKGIIHRDLKPGNILVTLHDGVPVVKVIDFGVAKALYQPLTANTVYTAVAQLVGTPLYMSPEQAEMSGLDVDTRSDVYSLGVLLYELLTGQTPFARDSLRRVGIDEMRRLIREVDPPRPSQRVSTLDAAAGSTISARRGLEQRQLRRELRGELDWIVMKCLEKNRNHRYDSASALAHDVQRFLGNQPIVARPASAIYRTRKWLRRHPTIALVCGLGILAVTALSIGGWYHNSRLGKANAALHAANRELSSALAAARKLEADAVERERLVRMQTYARDIRSAYTALDRLQFGEALRYVKQYMVKAEETSGRDFECNWLQTRFPAALRTLRGRADPLIALDVSPDERWIASGDKAGVIKIWDLESGREVRTLQDDDEEITCVQFSPDGQTLATAGVDRAIHLWNVSDWRERGSCHGHEQSVASLAWSPDSARLVSGGRDHQLKVWDAKTGQELRALEPFRDVVRSVAWSPQGDSIVAAVRENGVYVVSTGSWQTQELRGEDTDRNVLDFCFSPDGEYLASGGYGGRIELYETASRTHLWYVQTTAMIASLAFTPDMRHLVAGLGSGELQVCQLDERTKTITFSSLFQLGQGTVRSPHFIQSGRTMVSGLAATAEIEFRPIEQFIQQRRKIAYSTTCLAIAASKNLACCLNAMGQPQIESYPPGKVLGLLDGTWEQPVKCAVFFDDDRRLLIHDGVEFRVYDTQERKQIGSLQDSAEGVQGVAVSHQGNLIAAPAMEEGRWGIGLWDAVSHHRLRSMRAPLVEGQVRLAFSPDDKLLAISSPGMIAGKVSICETSTGDLIAEFAQQAVNGLAFSPDGQLLAGVYGWELMLWDMAKRNLVAVLRGHEGTITDLAFSPGGRTLATVDDVGVTRLWHVPTRQEIGILSRESLPGSHISFRSPSQIINWLDADSRREDGGPSILIFDSQVIGGIPTWGQ